MDTKELVKNHVGNILDEWTFLEVWMRDYYHSDEIAEIDDIDCMLKKDADGEKMERLLEYYGNSTIKEIFSLRNRLMRCVLEDAFKNYLDTNYPDESE